MSTDGAGITDDVQPELNPGSTVGPLDQLDSIPDRPADGAAKAKWVAYAVALGAHPDSADGMSRDELVELAGRLGG